jgi:hypothetical protein
MCAEQPLLFLQEKENKMSNSQARQTRQEQLEEQIIRLSQQCKLDTWTQFVDELKIPMDIYPALASGRPELIKLAKPRDLTAVETEALLNIIGCLIETNFALREHAAQLADFVGTWTDAFKHLRSVGDRIQRFALFDHEQEIGDE